jgi:hypothetical protein
MPTGRPTRLWRKISNRLRIWMVRATARRAPRSPGGRRRSGRPPAGPGARPAGPRSAHPRPCHQRAIHSSLQRSRADHHGQRLGGLDLRRFLPSRVTAPPDLALGAPSTNAHEFVDHPARAGVVNPAQKVCRRPWGADEAEVRSSGKRCPTFRQYGGQLPMMRLGPGLVLRPVRSRRCRR